MNYEGDNYNKAHERALLDYGIDYKKYFYEKLYTPNAIKTGDAYDTWKVDGKVD